MTTPLNNPAVPAIPVAPQDYKQSWGAATTNTLRLYFNQLKALLDNFVSLATSFQDGTFGPTVKFPHVAAVHEAPQHADGDNTPTLVVWDTLVSSFQFTFDNPSDSATAEYDGIYRIDYSLQFANTDNTAHDAIVWLRVDGDDLDNSTTKFTIQARKSAGVPSYVCGASFVEFEVLAGQTIELFWGTDQAYESGVTDGIYMFYEAAQTTPMPYPAVPSAIGSITFVSALP